MWLVVSVEKAQEGWLGSHGQQLKRQRDSSTAREFPLRSVGSNLKLGSPAYSTRARKGTQITSSYEKQQGFCMPGRDSLLKGQHTEFHLQPLTPGAGEGRARVD